MRDPGFSSRHQPARNVVTRALSHALRCFHSSAHLGAPDPLALSGMQHLCSEDPGALQATPQPASYRTKSPEPFRCSSAVEHGTFQAPFGPCALIKGLCCHFHFTSWCLLLYPPHSSSDHKHASPFSVLEPSSHQPARTLATGDTHIEVLSSWEAAIICARDPFAVLEAAGSWPPSPDGGLPSDTCLPGVEGRSASLSWSSWDPTQPLRSKCSACGLLVLIMTEQSLAVWQARCQGRGGQVGSQPATRSGEWGENRAGTACRLWPAGRAQCFERGTGGLDKA